MYKLFPIGSKGEIKTSTARIVDTVIHLTHLSMLNASIGCKIYTNLVNISDIMLIGKQGRVARFDVRWGKLVTCGAGILVLVTGRSLY